MRNLVFVAAIIIGSVTPVLAPSMKLSLQSPPVGSISVGVWPKEKTGAFLRNATVVAIRQPGKNSTPLSTTTPDKKGYYVITLLVPGTYSVTASAPGYKPRSKQATVIEYKSTPLNLELPRN
jgi:Carboxypeptidase regulatory-like domain